jgi:methionyl-tRNA synthetase
LQGGKKIEKAEPLFPRIDETLKLSELNNTLDVKETPENVIDINYFKKVELLAARVLDAEHIKNSEKLLKLIVDVGSKKKTIVAGIGQFYSPEDIKNKTIVIVNNLKPTKLMGVESQGMLLAATTKDRVCLVELPDYVDPGTRLK